MFGIWFGCAGKIVIDTAAVSDSGTGSEPSPTYDDDDEFNAAPPSGQLISIPEKEMLTITTMQHS